MYKKSFSILFALLIICSVLISCAADKGSQAPETTTSVETGPAVTEDPEPDNLPEMDFSGYEFKLYCRSCCPTHKDGLWQAESTGDIVNDAVFDRNKKVEERFNCIIAEPLLSDGEDTSVITAALLAGDCMADVIIPHFRFLGDMVLKQLMYDLAKIDYLDFSRPWWNTMLIENYSIFGRSFVAYGTIDVDNITEAGCILFNKKLNSNYLPDENFYKNVKDGAWTIDKMNSVVHSFGADLDGDGNVTGENDLFGLTGNSGYMFMYQVAMDQPTTRPNDDGEPELVINTPKMATIAEKMYDMAVAYEYSKVDNDTDSAIFIDSRSLFMTTKLSTCINKSMRSMEDDYGILPLPKYDEAQTSYFSHGSAHSNMLGIAAIQPEIERTGIILEALAAEGYKMIKPAVYDVALKQKGARDDDSAEMIDIICATRTGDFADLYDEWGLVYTLDHMNRAKIDTFASFYAKNEKASIKRLSKAIDLFREMP